MIASNTSPRSHPLARHRSGVGVAAFAACLVLGLTALPAQQSAVRTFTGPLGTTAPFQVAIRLIPPAGATNATLIETVPSGWTISNVSDGGTFNANMITWLLDSNLARTVVYTLAPDAASAGDVEALMGDVSYLVGGGSEDQTVYGDRFVVVPPINTDALATRALGFAFPQAGGELNGIGISFALPDNPGLVVVDEETPPGWTPADVNEGGLFTPGTGIRWAFPVTVPASVGYDIMVPGAIGNPGDVIEGQFNFYGEVSFSGTTLVVGGDQRGFIPVLENIVNSLLGLIELTAEEQLGHDTNSDAILDVGDVVTLINN